jgi:hypothetical protein
MEVEDYFVHYGYFIPPCHQSYWLGYKAQFWGRWLPLDGNVNSNGSSAYKNFGRFPITEPDGRRIPALCTVANSSQSALNTTFGWGDVDCDSGKHPYICRIIRELSTGPGPLQLCLLLQLQLVWPLRDSSRAMVVPASNKPPTCLCCLPAAPNVYRYNSTTQNATYILNTNPSNFKGAQSYCNSQGGHLVSYRTYDEQVEVESRFIAQVRASQPLCGLATDARLQQWATRAPKRPPHCPSTQNATQPPPAAGLPAAILPQQLLDRCQVHWLAQLRLG